MPRARGVLDSPPVPSPARSLIAPKSDIHGREVSLRSGVGQEIYSSLAFESLSFKGPGYIESLRPGRDTRDGATRDVNPLHVRCVGALSYLRTMRK